MSLPLTRDQAWELFCEWTASESLRRHVLAVEACMRAYARRFGEDEERWGIVGLLHDLDYERFPDAETGHPRLGMAELERLGFPEDVVRAVASHADYLDVPRVTPMEKALYAVDELSGFVLAVAYVRPTGLEGLTAKSVRKKMKSPAFAAAVDRDALLRSAQELGVDFDEHVNLVVGALQPLAGQLGFDAAPKHAAAPEAAAPDAAAPTAAAAPHHAAAPDAAAAPHPTVAPDAAAADG
jgi:putative nucleotidyltransferase with HDIG domain